MSAEPSRKKAYSSDLRWRVVYQRIAMNLPFYRIARNLNIACSTANRIYRHFEQTGGIDPVQRLVRREIRALDVHVELHVIGFVIENPSVYLSEVCNNIQAITGETISPSTVCRLLKRYSLSRKKIRQIALQRCDSLRGTFMAQTFLLRREMFVWIDETGSATRDAIRKYGYALRGMRAEYHRVLTRGKRVNAIAAMSFNGIVALDLTTDSVNGERFFDFLRASLIPNMLPFDGTSPRSVVIMDNCSVHHVEEVTELLRKAGIVVLFLPPYSPDLNPLEEAFSYIKGYLRMHDELFQSIPSPLDLIRAAFDSITEEHCQAWISHSGYL